MYDCKNEKAKVNFDRRKRETFLLSCMFLLVVMTMMMQDYADYDVGVFMPRMMCWGEGHGEAEVVLCVSPQQHQQQQCY